MKLLKEIDTKKNVGFVMISPKLVKIAAYVLCIPLSKAIKNNLWQCVFPDDAKIAFVSPLDKDTSKKNGGNVGSIVGSTWMDL